MITIVDYNVGNLLSFVNLYSRLNIECILARSPTDLERASRIILPGVGSFDHAMESLEQSGMLPVLEKQVVNNGVPVLGICVGMQMLAQGSDEGTRPGLGWVKGHVKRFNESDVPMLPHMGWNDVNPLGEHPLFREMGTSPLFYFLHSYYFSCEHPENVLASTYYGSDFACAVAEENIHGVQFHPEKSHAAGIQLLRNFSEI
ncbi:imidazole glycerol phosphate synthase subunit HisH [Pseudomonas sp. KNUC1026]|uniref:imidazole glycerol phosphate synthase subunit HisH n=1 Tax=Pseudomonas sp. KNUC1026 TaxID=2893890 RepID=UPI001F1AE1DD|nr:imidazole glycerol phosphate synthase subunit HisH [Pseudomonas sp. KNUC1026]UFH48238.1 imidazole glycerol phosphate synthase subunit HisH [Pseudomonas sp. KNUC1026]